MVHLFRTSPLFRAHVLMGVNLFCQDLRSARQMSNPYVFPPFGLISPILRFLVPLKIPFAIVIPEFVPHPYWWPELMARCGRKLCIAKQGEEAGCLSHSVEVRFQTCPLSSYFVGGKSISFLI